MANHVNSVFGAGATELTPASTMRVPAYNTGSDGNKYWNPDDLIIGRFTKTSTDTTLAGATVDIPHAVRGIMTTAPGSASSAVTAAILGANIHTGAASTGHNVALFGLVDNQSANAVTAMYAIEGRVHQQSGSTSQTACFIAAAQTVTEGAAGSITAHIDYLSPAFSDSGHMASKFSWVNQDSGKGSLTEGYLNVKGHLKQHDHNVQAATAWINCDTSSGTPVDNGSFNVASLTDSGIGVTQVNYSDALASGGHSVTASGAPAQLCFVGNTGTTTSFIVYTFALSTLLATDGLFCATVHGGTQ